MQFPRTLVEFQDQFPVRSQYSSARGSLGVSSSEDAVTKRGDSNFQSGLAEPRDPAERQSEPSKFATEMNARRDADRDPSPRSPVRIHQGRSAKTPRNRVNFSAYA
jgi:hypothetical protein